MNEPLSSVTNIANTNVPQPMQGFYITGGTLPGSALSYVTREADRQLYEGLCQGQFCYVLTSRQMGKSSLMIRTATRLREAGIGVAVLDLTAIGQNLTAEQWYDGLLNRLGLQLQLEDELEEFWLDRSRLGPLQRWMKAIREIILPRVPGRLVIFVDEIDTVRSLPFSTDEFFAGIREFYNGRTEDPELERVTFCLLGVAAPSDLIQDTRTTPFNIGRRIELHDFTAAEATPLVEGLWREGQQGTALLQRVLYWTNGHPYLTQRLCQALAEYPSVQNVSSVDRKCAELFFAEGAQTKDDNLLFVRERTLRSEVELSGLLTLYEQVYRKRKMPNDEASAFVTTLRLAGLTRVADGQLRVRNRIYERSFDQQWIREHMPNAELRRQRAAYRQGLLRAGAVAALILAVIGVLAFTSAQGQRQAIRLQKIAEQEKEKAEQQRNRAEEATRRADLNAQRLEISLAETEQQRQEAINQQMIAEEQRLLADEQRSLAEAQKEINYRQLYTAQMNLAGQAWETGNLARMGELLNLHLPQTGRKDLRGFEWYLLRHLGHNEAPILQHNAMVNTMVFSPDASKLITGSLDVVKLWEVATGRELATFGGHKGYIVGIAFSPDGQKLAMGYADNTAKLWDVATGREVFVLTGHTQPVRSVAFSPDGKLLATGSLDGLAKLWEVTTGREKFSLKGHEAPVENVAFSPNNDRLATFSRDSAKLWEVATGKELFTLGGHKNSRSAAVGSWIAFSPDGKKLATIDTVTTKLWDVATGKVLFTLQGHDQLIRSIDFSPDGKMLATGGFDNTTKLWDVITGRILFTLRGHNAPIRKLAFSPDGKKLATGSVDYTTKLWDVSDGREVVTLKGHTNQLTTIAFSPDGKWLATGSADSTARLWNVATGLKPITYPGHQSTLATFSSNTKRLVTTGTDAATRRDWLRVWDLDSRKELLTIKELPRVLDAAVSPDGKVLATGNADSTGTLWDVVTGQKLHTLTGHGNGGIYRLVFSPDGKRLTTASNDRTARIWEVRTGKELFTLKGHQHYVEGLNISHDGKMLATGSHDRTVKLWDVATGREIATLKGHEDIVECVAFSPDGRLLSSAGADRLIKIWDIASRQVIATFKGHSGSVHSIAFSPDGRRLASGSHDTTAKLWDVETGQELITLSESGRVVAVTVSFSPDGTILATSSAGDLTTKLWRIATKEGVSEQLLKEERPQKK